MLPEPDGDPLTRPRQPQRTSDSPITHATGSLHSLTVETMLHAPALTGFRASMRCVSGPQMLVDICLTDGPILNQQVDPKGLVLRKAHEDDLIPPCRSHNKDHVGTAALGCPAERSSARSDAPAVRALPQAPPGDET